MFLENENAIKREDRVGSRERSNAGADGNGGLSVP